MKFCLLDWHSVPDICKYYFAYQTDKCGYFTYQTNICRYFAHWTDICALNWHSIFFIWNWYSWNGTKLCFTLSSNQGQICMYSTRALLIGHTKHQGHVLVPLSVCAKDREITIFFQNFFPKSLENFQKFGKVWKSWKKVWKNFSKLYLLGTTILMPLYRVLYFQHVSKSTRRGSWQERSLNRANDLSFMDLIQVGVSVTGSKKKYSSASFPGRARHGPCSGRDYIFKIFSNLCQFVSKCGKVSVSSKAFGLVPFCSISFLLLLVRSVIMTGLPLDCHGSCTDTVEQCTVHIADGPARAQLE